MSMRFFALILPLFLISLNAVSGKAQDLNLKIFPREALTKERIANTEDLKGKIVIIDFWAAWCEPCKEALPHYNKLYQKYKDQGVVFIGINEDDDDKLRDAYLKNNPITFPMYSDPGQKLAKEYKVQAIPTLFIFDRNQKQVSMFRGFTDNKLKQLEKKIQDLLKK